MESSMQTNSDKNKSKKIPNSSHTNNGNSASTKNNPANTKWNKSDILNDYKIALTSRQISLIGRKQVLNGKAKFGIFGDGKEIAQLAMAKCMQNGDLHVGYYRDQTVCFYNEMTSYEKFFSQLYADVDSRCEVTTVGLQMNGFCATRTVENDGTWKNLSQMKITSSDTSPTGSQMPRAVGMALASKLFRENPELAQFKNLSTKGNEVVFCTIGDASSAEGLFWESVNAIGVLQAPAVISIWDDGYGISVPKSQQLTKDNIAELLSGFEIGNNPRGFKIYRIHAWDYATLTTTYAKAVEETRRTHIPAIFHIAECTQPQGHSTSGSHERYKSKERLQWEQDWDCIQKMRQWMLANNICKEAELKEIENKAEQEAKEAQDIAWNKFRSSITKEFDQVCQILENAKEQVSQSEKVAQVLAELRSCINPVRRDIAHALRTIVRLLGSETPNEILNFKNSFDAQNKERFNSHLYSQTPNAALKVAEVKAKFSENSPQLNGNQIIKNGMDAILARDPRVCIFGEDVGIGDVNHGLVGLPEKYGPHRIFDTGIREATIIGQGLGMAMRGLRPIAEIQYLDYLLFGFQTICDDLATLRYRNYGGQIAPLIIRTRGHRLEGIWHTGSPMGMIINGARGVYVLVPRNMVQAIGFYNTMLKSDDPAIIIECLNGYGVKEKLPDNLGEMTVPLGVPEVLRSGNQITIVTYGSCVRIVAEAAEELAKLGVSCEVIDVQSLIPFDINQSIVESLKKTNRILFVDEDVPGGASAYMLQQVLEVQGGYFHLDAKPATLTATEHRTPYSSDGDYFSKPSVDDVVEKVLMVVKE